MNTSTQEVLANNDVNVTALLGAREAQYKTQIITVKHYVRKILEQTLNIYNGTMYLK